MKLDCIYFRQNLCQKIVQSQLASSVTGILSG